MRRCASRRRPITAGSRWIGTGGNSPFGHSGNSSGGVKVDPAGTAGGRRSALKVIGERRYIDYSDDNTLSHANLSQALASMKSLKPAGPRDQLDLDATIYESARNGGEIELVFRRDLMDRIEVVLLIDNGGTSMLPHVALTRLLFAKVRDRFKRRDTYFFHNTIYGSVYKDPQRRNPLPLGKAPPALAGDASADPGRRLHGARELLYPGGAITWETRTSEPSIRRLERLRDRFRHSVWLNPIPKENWPEAYGRTTLKRIGEIFRMEDLTLGGIKRAVEWLNRK